MRAVATTRGHPRPRQRMTTRAPRGALMLSSEMRTTPPTIWPRIRTIGNGVIRGAPGLGTELRGRAFGTEGPGDGAVGASCGETVPRMEIVWKAIDETPRSSVARSD